ncbi:MAG: sulfatase-like hydrolase/transferase [Fimbriimonadaceae bacterium]
MPVRPNLVVLVTDQQNFRMMGCAGNPHVRTPSLDALAASGTRFTRVYSTNPVCSPSRFSLMTGLYPSAIGMWDNESGHLPPIPDSVLDSGLGWCLRKAGYRTLFGGKEHFPKRVRAERLGFEYVESDERELLASASAELLRGLSGSPQPFCYVANFINPHDICYMAIRDFAETDSDRRLLRNGVTELQNLDEALAQPDGVSEDEFFAEICPPLPDNHQPQIDEPTAIGALLDRRIFRRRARERYTERDWRLHRWAYARLTERVDAQLGVVLDAIAETGLDRSTVVVFTSDHGELDAAHKMEHKDCLYEEASHVPMIVRLPGQTSPGTADPIVGNGLDLLPTLCDFAGAEVPEGLEGRSIRPILEGERPEWREYLRVESEVGEMLVGRRYKYLRYTLGADEEQLLDLETDPGETRDHRLDPDAEAAFRDLRRRFETRREPGR